MRVYSTVLTADNTDVLQGTDLQSLGRGILSCLIASTQTDTVVTITGPDQVSSRLVNVIKRTDGMPDANSDVPYEFPILTDGSKIVINVDIVTGATVGVIVAFTPEQEL